MPGKSFRRRIPSGIGILCFILLLSGCSSDSESKAPSGTFTGKQPKMQSGGTSKSYFARKREEKQRYEREFRDVRHPMNQDHFRVTPWSGKHYNSRSEELHDASRNPDYSLFRF